MSPNACFVLISPAPFATVNAPSFTSHLASPPASADHLLRSFPSKITMASEGGPPGTEAGVTLTGLRSQTSVTVGSSDSRGLACERAPREMTEKATMKMELRIYYFLDSNKCRAGFEDLKI